MAEAIDFISTLDSVFEEDGILGDVLEFFIIDNTAMDVRAFQGHGGLWIGDWADIWDIPVNLS